MQISKAENSAYIDLIDLKFTTDGIGSKNIFKDLGYSDVAIRNAKNIYLLSERDYMKLIKIQLEDGARPN